MRSKRLSLIILVLIFLAAQASSQGYAGTVTTGTGIIPPLKVGSSGSAADNLGSGSEANLTGVWSLDLLDSSPKHIDLDIQQSKEILMGYGSVTGDGNSRRVKASGNISGGHIELFVSVIDSSEMYLLGAYQSGTSLSGKYDLYSAGAIMKSGTVKGIIKPLEASGGRATIILGNHRSQSVPTDVRSSATTQESIQGATSNGLDNKIESRRFSTGTNGQVTTSDVAITTNYG